MDNPRRFRTVMGHFATGVSVVTGRDDDGSFGLTVNSVASVSLEPTLVLVCLDRASASLDRILTSGVFAVNVLGAQEEWVARRFSGERRAGRFRGVEFHSGVTGAPLLNDALAWVDCRLWEAYEGGDHVIVLGEVAACGNREGPPLIFFRGRYRRYDP